MFQSIVEAVFHYSNTQPDKMCLIDDNSQVTYKEYAEKIKKYATCFDKMGLQAKDTVVVEACQTIEYLAIELALQLLGIIFVPVEHNCAAEKIRAFTERANAKAVIVCKEDSYNTEYNYTFDALVELCGEAEPYQAQKLPLSTDISEVLFSTGTTGKEKGISLLMAITLLLQKM